MVKHISVIYRPPNTTHEEAVQYWKNVHTEIVKARLPGLRRYVGNFPVQPPDSDESLPGGGAPMRCDAVIELHFDSLEALRAAMAAPAWQSDERRTSSAMFMDYSRMQFVVTEEVVVSLD